LAKRVPIPGILVGVFLASVGLHGQTSPAHPYRLEWKHNFAFLAFDAEGTSSEDGTLWLIVRPSPGKPEELTRISPDGNVTGTFAPAVPLNPIQWVDYLSPATSGNRTGLLVNVVSGRKNQTQEGAFFLPVGSNGLGPPIQIAPREGPQFPHLIGDGTGQFIAIGDQSPITLMKLGATGNQIWRRSFTSKFVLPDAAVSAKGEIFVLSEGGGHVLLQLLDQTGRVLRSKGLAAKQGTVVANEDGGCTVLLSKKYGGRDNRVYLVRLSQTLGEQSEIETPLVGWGGREYQLISSPRGHLAVGPGTGQEQQILVEFDKSGKLLWQRAISSPFTPRLIPFHSGFYLVKAVPVTEGGGTIVEKYVFEN
jgi:hypothetical protein